MAPNVVDATAVDLSDDVSDGDDDSPVGEAVPEFNPMDSDGEDEFDAMSSVTIIETSFASRKCSHTPTVAPVSLCAVC